MKICSKCKEEKEYSEFHKHKYSKDGYRYICKNCRKDSDRAYYINNNIKEKTKEKRKIDKRYLKSNKKYRDNNQEFVKNLRIEWSKSENGKISKRKYYINNSDRVKENVKKYRENNKESIYNKEKIERKTKEYKEYMSKYIFSHRKRYPHIYAWRSLLTNTIKRLNTKKSKKTIEMLGFSAEELKIHLESLFKEGMSWENYGKWHIDHIKPVSLFDKEEDVKVVNALVNLQPLWANENLSKYNHYN